MKHPLAQFLYCPECGSPHFEVNNEKSKKCTDCGFVYYFNPSSATVALILNEKKELLVCRRAKEPAKGTLDLPGGFIDMAETGEEGVAREVKEETGYTLTSWAYRGIVTFVYGEDVVEYMSLYTADGFEGEPIDCDEGELEWVEKSKIETLKLWEGDKIFFDLLERDCGFFSLKLVYNIEDILKSAVLDGKPLRLTEDGKWIGK